MWDMVKHAIGKRLSAIRDILWQKWWRKALLGVYFIAALWDYVIRLAFPDKEWLTVSALFPDWGWEYWLIIGLVLVLFLTLEGAYRIQRKKSSGNLILDYEAREGKLPELPRELHELFPRYTLGKPISYELEAITPSAQFLRNLSRNQPLVEFLFSVLDWQGKDPRDYIAGSTGTPIVWSGQNPKELAKDFVSHWQNIISRDNERRNRRVLGDRY